MNKYHYVDNVRFEGKVLHLVVDGEPYRIDVTRQSARLRDASLESIKRVEVSPSGYGLHWPDIDEDLSIDGLIGIRHEIPRAVAEPGEAYGD
jgi:hypothetical protein